MTNPPDVQPPTQPAGQPPYPGAGQPDARSNNGAVPPPQAASEAGLVPAQPMRPVPGQVPAGMTSRGKVRTTRVSAWWVGLIIAAVLLIALLIFIAQNSNSTTIHYLGMHGQISLAIALLLSAAAGVLLVAIPGTARIFQLRRALKKNAGAHADSRQKS